MSNKLYIHLLINSKFAKMKKLGFIAFAACITLASCADDDSNESVNGNVALEGTWELTTFNLQGGVDLNNDGTISENFMTETGCFDNSTVVFNNNGVATFYVQGLDIGVTGAGTTEAEYTVDCLAPTPVSATYTATETSVTFDFEGTDDDEQPLSFARNGNTLVSTAPPTALPIDQNGIITDFVVEGTVILTKQ